MASSLVFSPLASSEVGEADLPAIQGMVPRKQLRRWRERAQTSLGRWPRLQPFLTRPDLWAWSRRSVCRGAAIGVFFGLVMPVAQIPVAVLVSAFWRANITVAMLGTLITNPLTSPVICYGMYRLGTWMLSPANKMVTKVGDLSSFSWLDRSSEILSSFLVGAPVVAIASATLTYLCLSLTWRLWVQGRRPRLFRATRAIVRLHRFKTRKRASRPY